MSCHFTQVDLRIIYSRETTKWREAEKFCSSLAATHNEGAIRNRKKKKKVGKKTKEVGEESIFSKNGDRWGTQQAHLCRSGRLTCVVTGPPSSPWGRRGGKETSWRAAPGLGKWGVDSLRRVSGRGPDAHL